jgi:hypothetical protein
MPLVIPAPRNLIGETFTAYMIGREENRVREEQRRRQEEAADSGGGALGGAIGMGLGILLALPTGGASLSLTALTAGAAVGSGVGQLAGTAIDPPGRGYPGGAAGQYAQGINRISQGVLRAAQIEASTTLSENEKQEAFLNDLMQTYGGDAVTQFAAYEKQIGETARAANQPAPTQSELRQTFIKARGTQIQQSAFNVKKGFAMAKAVGEDEADKLRLYMKNRFGKLETVFEMDGHSLREAEGLRRTESLINEDLASNRITQEQASAFRLKLRRQQAELSRRLIRKPPALTSIQQMRKAGKPLQRGGVYTDENIPGSIVSISDKGTPFYQVPPNTVVQDKANPNRFLTFDIKGKQQFSGYRRADGKIYGVGQEFEIPGQPGLFQYDTDSEIKQVPGTGKDGDDDLFKPLLSTATKYFTSEDLPLGDAGDKKGALTLAEDTVRGAGQAAERLREEQQVKQQREARAKELQGAGSVREVMDILGKSDPKVALSAAMLKQAVRTNFGFPRSTETLENAAATVVTALRNMDRTRLSPAVQFEMIEMAEEIASIVEQHRRARGGGR